MPRKYADANRRGILYKVLVALLSVTIVLLLINVGVPAIKRVQYPLKYTEYVDKYSGEYGVDSCLVYAVMKVESGFDSGAVSGAGAKGLMQLTEDTFQWVKFRLKDEREIDFKDMLTPEYNIQYGTFLLATLGEEYGGENIATIAAAYHAGRGQANQWLEDSACSSDGIVLERTPSRATNHYISKIEKASAGYRKLLHVEHI